MPMANLSHKELAHTAFCPQNHAWLLAVTLGFVTHTADGHAKNSNESLTQKRQLIQSSFQMSLSDAQMREVGDNPGHGYGVFCMVGVRPGAPA